MFRRTRAHNHEVGPNRFQFFERAISYASVYDTQKSIVEMLLSFESTLQHRTSGRKQICDQGVVVIAKTSVRKKVALNCGTHFVDHMHRMQHGEPVLSEHASRRNEHRIGFRCMI